jgi:glycosyltransferase involved in cell wall biosynthesis
MIVKNEARLIQDCLRSTRDVVDQMVVVDTGSTDDTARLAEAEGAEVYYHPWRDSFSEARNHSLDYARGQWILILDGDEVLDPQTIDLIHQLDLSEHAPDAYEFEIINFTTDRAIEEESGVISQVRLFRNHPCHRYGGRVHNQIHNIETGGALEGPCLKVKVLHYGYTPAVWSAQNKDERLVLHERSIAEFPDNHFVRYNYGNHLKILGHHQEALNQFILAIPPVEITGVIRDYSEIEGMRAELSWGLNACFLGAFCANHIGEYQIALSLTEEALMRAPMLLDARVRRAEALLHQHRYHEAIELLRTGLLMERPYVVKGRALYYDAPYRLGRALFLSNQQAEAAAPFASLLPRCSDVTVLTHLCLCAIQIGLKPLWLYARQRGAELAADDPDWMFVDSMITQSVPKPTHQLTWVPLCIDSASQTETADDVRQAWIDHLNRGLEELEPDLSRHLSVIDIDMISTHPEMPYLMLTLYPNHARLSFRQGDQVIYSFPEHYALLNRALPPESSSLLLTHMVVLGS